MTKLVLCLLVVATLVPVRSTAQAPDAARLAGRWSGSGTFSDADVRKKVGSIPFAVEFKADRSVTGRVGNATLQDARMKSARDLIEVRAKLTGSIGADPVLAKDYLVLLVTKVNDSTIRAEFHLKSNLTFDPRMREGRVVLTRVP